MTKPIPPWVFALAVLSALLMAFWAVGTATPTTGESALIGKPAPVVEGKTTTGDTFRLSDHKNEVVLVNFWATWCGPCVMEIPDLVAVQEKYRARGFTIVGLSQDDSLGQVRPFVKQHGVNYPVLLAPPGVGPAFGGVPAIPTSFLLSKGQIVYSTVGLITRDELEREIEKVL